MNDDELWAAIDAQRVRTVKLLQDLTPAEWDHASLCDGWRVRDVAAHLTMQQMTLRDGLKGLLRHPGGMNHVIHAAAVSEANRRPPEQLIAEISGTIGSRRFNVGVTPRETLLDIIVHGQDIAIPLRRQLEVANQGRRLRGDPAVVVPGQQEGTLDGPRVPPGALPVLPADRHRY